jgi:tetratricopeptide (TPR) repeat protein
VGDFDEAKQLHVQFDALPGGSTDYFTECLYYYSANQPSLAIDPCNAMTHANATSNTAWSNAAYVALDLGQYALAKDYFQKSWSLYDASKDKHTVAEELDISWGIILANYYTGDKKDARVLYRAIKKSYPEIATMSALKQLPLVWSQGTQDLINKVIADFK